MVDAEALGFKLEPSEARDLVELGERIKRAAAEQIPGRPSREPGDPHDQPDAVCRPAARRRREDGPEHRYRLARVVTIVALRHRHHARVWRCCMRREQIAGRRKVRAREPDRHRVHGRDPREGRSDQSGRHASITGRAWITAFHQYVLDPTDPFPLGFRVGDTWPDWPERGAHGDAKGGRRLLPVLRADRVRTAGGSLPDSAVTGDLGRRRCGLEGSVRSRRRGSPRRGPQRSAGGPLQRRRHCLRPAGYYGPGGDCGRPSRRPLDWRSNRADDRARRVRTRSIARHQRQLGSLRYGSAPSSRRAPLCSTPGSRRPIRGSVTCSATVPPISTRTRWSSTRRWPRPRPR